MQLFDQYSEVGVVPVHHKSVRFVGLSESSKVVTVVLFPDQQNVSFNFTLQVATNPVPVHAEGLKLIIKTWASKFLQCTTSCKTSRGGWGFSSVACHAAAPSSNPANSNGIFRFIRKIDLNPSSDIRGGYIGSYKTASILLLRFSIAAVFLLRH